MLKSIHSVFTFTNKTSKNPSNDEFLKGTRI